jgi:hypothetical protein
VFALRSSSLRQARVGGRVTKRVGAEGNRRSVIMCRTCNTGFIVSVTNRRVLFFCEHQIGLDGVIDVGCLQIRGERRVLGNGNVVNRRGEARVLRFSKRLSRSEVPSGRFSIGRRYELLLKRTNRKRKR